MIKILFVRNNRAFLPEINAYLSFFNKAEGFKAYDSSKIVGEYKLSDFDVIWEFKGFGGEKAKEQILIHEYASLSTGTFPKFKNILKTKLNPKPDLRVFLNENVNLSFGFTDSIEYCYRDMGVDEIFLHSISDKKEYDFVYVGPITKEREIDRLLKNFTAKINGKICLVGNVESDIYGAYKNNKDIIFTGKVPYTEVPNIASKALYGLNFMPNKYPYNIQTSTKLLEYLALGLKVITTDYKWVRQFEEKHNCLFHRFDPHGNFSVENLENQEYKTNFQAEDFIWGRIIEKSGIKERILDKGKFYDS